MSSARRLSNDATLKLQKEFAVVDIQSSNVKGVINRYATSIFVSVRNGFLVDKIRFLVAVVGRAVVSET